MHKLCVCVCLFPYRQSLHSWWSPAWSGWTCSRPAASAVDSDSPRQLCPKQHKQFTVAVGQWLSQGICEWMKPQTCSDAEQFPFAPTTSHSCDWLSVSDFITMKSNDCLMFKCVTVSVTGEADSLSRDEKFRNIPHTRLWSETNLFIYRFSINTEAADKWRL